MTGDIVSRTRSVRGCDVLDYDIPASDMTALTNLHADNYTCIALMDPGHLSLLRATNMATQQDKAENL